MSVFDMRKQRIRQVVGKQRKSMYHRIVGGDQRMLNFFSSKSCCLLMSLLKPIGMIRRCTKTVSNVFGMTSSELIGRSVNLLIPDAIAAIHDKIIDTFIKEGKMSRVMGDAYFLLGKSVANFIFPVEITMRLTNLTAEFGLTAFIQAIDNNNHYILIDDKLTLGGRKNKIIAMSKDLYAMCFA